MRHLNKYITRMVRFVSCEKLPLCTGNVRSSVTRHSLGSYVKSLSLSEKPTLITRAYLLVPVKSILCQRLINLNSLLLLADTHSFLAIHCFILLSSRSGIPLRSDRGAIFLPVEFQFLSSIGVQLDKLKRVFRKRLDGKCGKS